MLVVAFTGGVRELAGGPGGRAAPGGAVVRHVREGAQVHLVSGRQVQG